MERIRSRAGTRWLALVLLLASTSAAAECITLGQLWATYSQGFDSLVVNGTSSQLPPGWAISEGPAGDGLITADNGTATTPGVYSYATGTTSNRALGSLANASIAPVLGACFRNLTGTTITYLGVDYGGQQWRLGAPDRIDRLDFQISTSATGLLDGSWLDVNALDLKTISTGAAGSRDGNVAPNYVERRYSPIYVNIPPDTTFWIRWKDYNVSGEDDGLGIDWFNLVPSGSNPPRLTLQGVKAQEGNAGTTAARFVARLDAPAAAGGVHFIASTADFSANAGTDYVPVTLNGYIAAGKTATALSVNLIGDTDWEMDEQFLLQLGNATGAIITGYSAMGTILNDDPKIFEVHDIQAHRYFGSPIHVRGIVTARSTNGFFMQTPDADADGTGQGSEGLFVQTGTAPPATAVPGNLVIAVGTVQEFVPSDDPMSPSRTQLGGGPTVTVLSTGNPLPASILLPPIDINGRYDQLERYEGMRVTAGPLLVTGPTQGTVDERNALSRSDGVFQVVAYDVARPHREPGIESPNPPPAGAESLPLPVWDSNPELFAVDSDALGGAPINLASGSIIRGVAGVLDFSDRRYTILLDPASIIKVEAHSLARASRPASLREFTIASYDLGRFYDAVDDAASTEPVLTTGAFAGRLNKASLGIRDYLHLPDILGVQEVENLATLQSLAAKINSDQVAAGQADPKYRAYLFEGMAADRLDIGFLVKTATVDGVRPRIQVLSVAQKGKGTTWIDPGGKTLLLNNRPPLVLDAVVHSAAESSFPVTVVLVHQQERDYIDSETISGVSTLGDRVRMKRLRQSEFLAGLIQTMQATDVTRHIVVLGNFNAFEFNDGLVDVLDAVSGTPYYGDTTAVSGDGPSLVSPALSILPTYGASPSYPYTMVQGGNLQSFDHVLVNSALAYSADKSIDFARINADMPETRRNNFGTPSRLSSHDPVIAYFSPVKFADLSLSAYASSPVRVGQQMSFSTTVTNRGPDEAPYTAIGFAFSAALPDLAVHVPAGWTCDAVEVANGATSTSCFAPIFGYSATSVLTLTATAPSSKVGSQVMLVAVTTSSSTDDIQANNDASAATSVVP